MLTSNIHPSPLDFTLSVHPFLHDFSLLAIAAPDAIKDHDSRPFEVEAFEEDSFILDHSGGWPLKRGKS